MDIKLGKFGEAMWLTKVTLRSGREIVLCNEYMEVDAAVKEGKTFSAHTVLAMKPSPITINPAHVAVVEALK